MISYDFGMHHTGVLLGPRLLACRAGGRRGDRRRVLMLLLVMGVLRDPCLSHGQYKCARDYGCNVLSHFVWL